VVVDQKARISRGDRWGTEGRWALGGPILDLFAGRGESRRIAFGKVVQLVCGFRLGRKRGVRECVLVHTSLGNEDQQVSSSQKLEHPEGGGVVTMGMALRDKCQGSGVRRGGPR